MYNHTYTYAFFICCLEVNVSCMDTSFCQSYPHHVKRLSRPAVESDLLRIWWNKYKTMGIVFSMLYNNVVLILFIMVHFMSSVWSAVVKTNWCWYHPLPFWHESWWRSADSELVPIHPAMGVWVHRLTACMGWVCSEATGGQCTEQETHIGGSGGQLGQRHSTYQYVVPEGPTYSGLW